jgi:hypothetical protein
MRQPGRKCVSGELYAPEAVSRHSCPDYTLKVDGDEGRYIVSVDCGCQRDSGAFTFMRRASSRRRQRAWRWRFGASCDDVETDDGQVKTCSCTPPKTSADCRKFLGRCETELVPDPNRRPTDQVEVPKSICSATECLCDWVTKEVPGSDRRMKIFRGKMQQPAVAPAEEAAPKPKTSTRFRYMKPNVVKDTEEEATQPAR